MTFKQFDIVKVPFPFTDKASGKKRPAVIISSDQTFNNHLDRSIMAMITSSKHKPWPLDFVIEEPEDAGLPKTSLIRMKIFTIDNNLVIRKIGKLSKKDAENLKNSISLLFKTDAFH